MDMDPLERQLGRNFLNISITAFVFVGVSSMNEPLDGRAAVDLSLYKGRVFLSAGRVSLESDEEEWRYPKTEFENLLSVAWSKEAGRHYK